MNEEIWKPIKDNPKYQISSSGRFKTPRGKITLGSKIKSYLRVSFYINGKPFSKKVHRLVAIEFIPNPLNLETVNHKDGNTLNNFASNLEWMTIKDNVLHGKSMGKCMPNGLNIEKVLSIYTFHLSKYPGRYKLCTDAFKISSGSYDQYVSGKIRKEFHKKIFGGIK
jgi:hypothetical protein